uniref:Reverse transcriptase domain-containing protein n=1 Tax=Tanacetum cinerariifolium TaxID=118510 RepID=A0A6L2K236_TANCI|nr:reverse transcriptase domain-containing protein [Tanacetum cinerariifolium]
MDSLSKKYDRLKVIPGKLRISPSLPPPEQTPSLSLSKKRKALELEHEVSIAGLECNRSLPEGIPFVNNKIIKTPKHGIFFIDALDEQAFQRATRALYFKLSASLTCFLDLVKVPPKLGDPESFLIPCTFSKTFSCNALTDLGVSINIISYSLYAKLSLETLKPTKMSLKLANRSFQYPIGIAKNMLVEVGKLTLPVDFVILKMEEDNKVPLILGRNFLHTTDAKIRIKQKQLNLGVGSECIVFSINYAMKHSYSNDVINEILEEDFDALLDEGSKVLYSIEGTPLEDKIFA